MAQKHPTSAELRKAQAALDALNVAYEYFTPAPWLAARADAKPAAPDDYLPLGHAA
ncbi:hypothetical protein [Litorivita sp. NS0012-18]|uniref:hypothetical protein n=1 Tax=Litorivita sp. NS0012-18 TaxID=3127655 RepID=UPI0031088537